MAGRGGGRQGGGARRFDGGRGSKAPPSRHLWIGNLFHSITEDELTRHFLNFGDLESVAFLPGRSYAFINFKREEDAVAAMEALHGFPVAGNALRVEFTKADKSSVPLREEDYSQRRESAVRGSPLSQREFRPRQDTPEQFHQEKSSMGDKNTEPSEVLWIGFPALLKVDEFILRKSFAPFGEIEKITAFPGRSYAFVRFKSIMSASRAKAALQGKLFGNPRVHICFARSDTSSSSSGKNSINDPPSPHLKWNGRSGSSENCRQDKNFGSFTEDSSIRSPQYFSTLDSGGYEPYSLKRKGNFLTGENNTFEQRRPGEVSDLSLSQDMYGYRGSPTRERYAHLRENPQRFPQTNPLYDEIWDLPDDGHFFHGAKKLKTESYIPQKELPEYHMSVYEQEKHGFPRFTDFHQADISNRNFEIPERLNNPALPPLDRGDPWKEHNLQAGSVDRKRYTPESKKSLELWKWEGTIAKGGTPVCRARCFPVGKVLDMILPEFLDCTARTGLDMLSEHYDQATSAWVVFFAPGSDADIGYYNEFMQYLGEKQRAAVAKLDDRTTLFLVPPSEFSEKVLKVPGKLSISGVVLRIDQPSSSFGSHHQKHERNDTRLLSFTGDQPYSRLPAPSVSMPPFTSLPDSSKSGVSNPGSAHGVGNGYEFYNENRHEYPPYEESPSFGPNWSVHHPQSSVSVTRNRPNQVSTNAVDPALQEQPSVMQRPPQEAFPTGGVPHGKNSHFQDTQPSISLAEPHKALQPQQLARLASLLEQQRQSGTVPNSSTGEDFRHRNAVHETENLPRTYQKFAQQNNQVTYVHSTSQPSVSLAEPLGPEQLARLSSLLEQQKQSGSILNRSAGEEYRHRNAVHETDNLPGTYQKFVQQNSQVTSEPSTSQFGQAPEFQQPQQQVSHVPHTVQRDLQAGDQGNQHQQNSNTNEGGDGMDRMQATLQLAAALLQKIQQGKGS
ncbi:flowering time control protein FPA [Argentina anserina]|uniref:flowering time control protein FPA n=1 Tax=Argentina anserina TaxID=57926 RepID=UPI0021764C48|nr:flowering time control protein FPA [Potentilla anserina]